MSCVCVGISDRYERQVRYPYQNNKDVLCKHIENEFVVFITYYTLDVDLMFFVGLHLKLFCTRR